MILNAILVDIIPPSVTPQESLMRLNELEQLLVTFGGFAVVRKIQKKQHPDYRTYIGKGKVDEILTDAKELKADIVIVNNILKPMQLYNLEAIFEKDRIKVWDRIDLILEIFSKHAVTKEAKLQIELAKLKHLGPRIFKMGTELMRQGGGGSGGAYTRGQGETNIEIMKRHIRNREYKIREELEKIEVNQKGQRHKRKDFGFKTVSIVGYTNAGKSQLMVSLTKKNVDVRNALFATLDTRLGKLYLPDLNQSCLISDTIGFIRDLPPDLIDAFKSTLGETIDADLILHVIDIDDLDMEHKIKVVEDVLKNLKCSHKPILYVFNKIDRVQYEPVIKMMKRKYKAYDPVFVSAIEKTNLDELKLKIAQKLSRNSLDKKTPVR